MNKTIFIFIVIFVSTLTHSRGSIHYTVNGDDVYTISQIITTESEQTARAKTLRLIKKDCRSNDEKHPNVRILEESYILLKDKMDIYGADYYYGELKPLEERIGATLPPTNIYEVNISYKCGCSFWGKLFSDDCI